MGHSLHGTPVSKGWPLRLIAANISSSIASPHAWGDAIEIDSGKHLIFDRIAPRVGRSNENPVSKTATDVRCKAAVQALLPQLPMGFNQCMTSSYLARRDFNNPSQFHNHPQSSLNVFFCPIYDDFISTG